jgi:GNAT superfamily N-acetyltransferase
MAMNGASLAITPFDLRAASAQEYALLGAHFNRTRAEQLPDDPPIPLDERIRNWQHMPPFVEVFAWTARDAGGAAIVASGHIIISRTDDNQHLAEFGIDVAPEYRRQGLGHRVLAEIADTARREGRRLLITETTARVPAGAAFMERLGARKGLESHTNQLNLAEVNHELINRWLEQAGERAADFDLGCWDGPYPEAKIEAIIALHEVMNTEPRGSLDIEDFRMTPERLRQSEQARAARGTERWTLYVRERTTDRFAGFTEVFWHPNRPQILQQGATAVFPRDRNRGLGRWLKAAMIEKVRRERPDVRFIRTGNADSNAPMLKINQALGFKPYIAHTTWQVETEYVLRYLNGVR